MVLEMFRNEYIGTAPYISCCPSLRHHRLCPRDQFLILSSDGLYQYLSNQEVVSQVESFMEKFPDGDPAQHLIEELLLRAAKKAGKQVFSSHESFFSFSVLLNMSSMLNDINGGIDNLFISKVPPPYIWSREVYN